MDRLCPLGGGMIFSVSGPGVLQAAQGRLDERSRRILVLAVQSGPASVLANNGPLPLTAGSILLAHSELPLEVRSDEGSELVGFAAPAHFFSPRFVPIERIRGGALIPLEGAIAHLMSQLMASLVAPDRAIRDADAAVDAIGGLLAALTQNRWASEPKLRSVSRREARVEQIAVFIRRRFADPDLSPSTVADALGISPRYIHKVYSKNGRTFRQDLIAVRLEAILSAFSDQHQARKTIAAIALGAGYTDLSLLNRHFRQLRGVTPGQARRMVSASSRTGRQSKAPAKMPTAREWSSASRSN